MKHPRRNSIFKKITLIFACLALLPALSGCGGSNSHDSTSPAQNIADAIGSGGADVGNTQEDSFSPEATTLLARFVSGNYQGLSDRQSAASEETTMKSPTGQAEESPEIVHGGTGLYTVVYGPEDTLTSQNITYTYTSGSQNIRTADIYGNLTDDEASIEAITIESHDLAYHYPVGDLEFSAVSNGTISYDGFYYGTTYTVSGTGLRTVGSLSNGDTFDLSVPDSSVAVDGESFPYPRQGETEYGTLIYNGETYNYAVYYSGYSVALVQVTGTHTGSFYIDLLWGTVFSA